MQTISEIQVVAIIRIEHNKNSIKIESEKKKTEQKNYNIVTNVWFCHAAYIYFNEKKFQTKRRK